MTPECAYCGRRHGESPLVAPLEPLEFGHPNPYWVWLDEDPPYYVKKSAYHRKTLHDGKTWRSGCGYATNIPDPSLPRSREIVQLIFMEPLIDADDCDEFYLCDLCDNSDDRYLVSEGMYRATRLPLPHVTPKEQLALL